jgi:rubrerythrin
MDTIQSEAIVTAISIESRSLGFYYAVSGKVRDSNSKRVFENLAKDGCRLVRELCNLYQGNNDDLVTILNGNNLLDIPYYRILFDKINGKTSEIEALRIALEEKQECIKWYCVFRDTIREPHIYNMFEQIITIIRSSCEFIKEDLIRLLNLINSPDQIRYAFKGGTIRRKYRPRTPGRAQINKCSLAS